MADRAPWQQPPGTGPAANTDVVDRAARQLGVADILDRVGRQLGLVGPAAGATWDIGDRAARQLGVIAGVADQAVTGAIAAVGDTVAAAVRPGDTTWAVLVATAAGTLVFEVSFDNGASWRGAALVRGDTTTSGAAISGALSPGSWWEAAIPAGATNVRVRNTVAPGVAGTVVVATSRSNYEPLTSIAGAVDLSDRAGRALGAVSPAGGSTWDVADRAARALGVADVSDRKARALGVVRQDAQWSQVHAPAANVQASASRPAGGAGVVHVCTAIIASLSNSAATQADANVVLRDGATGAGTILAEWAMQIQAVAGSVDRIALTGLQIPGTANTAMTLEFTGSGGANITECVTLVGYDQ